MPAINVRLTDAEHAELFEAAHDNRRSMQKEILARLFPGVRGTPLSPEQREIVERPVRESKAAWEETQRAALAKREGGPDAVAEAGLSTASRSASAGGKRTYQPDLKGKT